MTNGNEELGDEELGGGLQHSMVVVENDEGDKVNAMLANCSCGCVAFIIFQIEGHDHAHFQCAECGITWCSKAGRASCYAH